MPQQQQHTHRPLHTHTPAHWQKICKTNRSCCFFAVIVVVVVVVISRYFPPLDLLACLFIFFAICNCYSILRKIIFALYLIHNEFEFVCPQNNFTALSTNVSVWALFSTGFHRIFRLCRTA